MDFYDGSAALNECATGDLGLPADRSPCPTTDQAVRAMIAATGDDPDREGLLETPARVARAWREWFAGYAIDPAALLARTFTESAGYEDTITLRSEEHTSELQSLMRISYAVF